MTLLIFYSFIFCSFFWGGVVFPTYKNTFLATKRRYQIYPNVERVPYGDLTFRAHAQPQPPGDSASNPTLIQSIGSIYSCIQPTDWPTIANIIQYI